MSDDPLGEMGELVFSIVISYFGALEFFFVVQRLIHWSFRHSDAQGVQSGEENQQSLQRLQDELRERQATAHAREAAAGTNAMQDGVAYVNGFRVDPAHLNKGGDLSEERRREIEAELERQKRIEIETRKQLEEAEARLAMERKLQAEEAETEAKAKAEQQKQKQKELEEAEAENTRKLLEAEKAREAEQRRIEEAAAQKEAEENERKLLEAERERAREHAENERKLLEEQERAAANERKLLEEQESAAENERKLLESETQRATAQREQEEAEAAQTRRDAEIVQRLLEAERARKLSATESELEEEAQEAALQVERLLQKESERLEKQKLIEENARLFLEAEEEMVALQQRMLDAASIADYEGQVPVVEEPCVKKIIPPKYTETYEPIVQKVKTQFGQTSAEHPYSHSSKSLLFPSVSDEGTSLEPNSSQQSSFSTQASDDFNNNNNQERQEPDGVEDNVPDVTMYTDDYLRSLDGIKSRPLFREDGSGRRRAFKKRRSSGSSNSSRESRHSREEEVKMFTSLEEEELRHGDKSDYTPIKYTSEPTLRVKSQHRRHKRSPAKDMKPTAEEGDASELLDEDDTNPWGEVVPEHYKDTEFWKREKAMSIDEEELEFERPATGGEVQEVLDANNLPKTSSFEEATHAQNEEAATTLQQQRQLSKETAEKDSSETSKEQSNSDNKSNLQTSNTTEEAANAHARASSSPRLRRSPRIEEINQYEERWREEKESTQISSPQPGSINSPTISIHAPDVAPWRDSYGLIMEGLSDFYDFTASVNPSRSRSTSRNPSPAPTQPNTPQPKNVANEMNIDDNNKKTIEVYDDTEQLSENEFNRENIIDFIEANLQTETESVSVEALQLQLVADDHNKAQQEIQTMIYELREETEETQHTQHTLVETLREARIRTDSRSRSRSPLPTSDNLERSIATRRSRLIKHNEEIFEKLIQNNATAMETETTTDNGSGEQTVLSKPNLECFVESLLAAHSRSRSPSPMPEIRIDEASEETTTTSTTTTKMNTDLDDSMQTEENIREFVESLRAERRSRTRSRSRSPLPTADNVARSLESRRLKRIQHNDELFEQLTERVHTAVESNTTEIKTPVPTISIECVEMQTETETQMEMELTEEECDTKESIAKLVEQLRINRSRSHTRTRSKTPLPNAANFERSIESRRHKLIAQNDEIFEKLQERAKTPEPIDLSIEYVFETEDTTDILLDAHNARSLSPSRSRSHSRSMTPPNRDAILAELSDNYNFHVMLNSEASDSKMLHKVTEECESVLALESKATHLPKFKITPNRDILLSQLSDNYNFHVMLNTEASDTKTLSKNSEEYESMLAAKQRELDLEALYKLTNASEEIELRLLSPSELEFEQPEKRESPIELEVQQMHDETKADTDQNLNNTELEQLENANSSTKEQPLRSVSPITPDYERTISEECRDVQRIKEEILASGFKRSTYVGESFDLGCATYENDDDNDDAESGTTSLDTEDLEIARAHAAAQRELQAAILDSLSTASNLASDEKRLGAKPKSYDYERTLSEEVHDTERLKEELLSSGFKRSTYVGESLDLAAQLDDLRHRTAEFQRSRSQSRSPLADEQVAALKSIDAEVAKRELQDQLLDQFTASTMNFQNFSRHLNVDFLDSERRASDSALMQDADIFNMEPDEYHHFRRYSLAQEQPVEEYPSDDFVCVSQIEVRTLTGTRTWLKEDYYGTDFDISKLNIAGSFAEENFSAAQQQQQQQLEKEVIAETSSSADDLSTQYSGRADASNTDADDDDGRESYDEASSNDSEDERQTVVDVENEDEEFDEGISDYNERGGPTDESHHETSECEEAEREADRYANRDANDWEDVENVDDFLDYGIEEGAVGGVTPYSDPDSFIEQIYNDAIKNRKQSGILRDYESIFQDVGEPNAEAETEKANNSSDSSERYAKTKKFLESERREGEVRYLGDANVTARQSTRLRSRYGYNPQLQSSAEVDDLDVDLNYTPKREYNWRKNFKVDDDDADAEDQDLQAKENDETTSKVVESNDEVDELLQDYDDLNAEYMDMRRYSFGGESITLFSRSPERERLELVPEEENDNDETKLRRFEEDLKIKEEENNNNETQHEPNEIGDDEKPKKKKTKTKKKTRKGSKAEEDAKDEEDYENQLLYSRRSSSVQMEATTTTTATTDSPKRKSRSRRSSKSSLNNEETNATLFSPRSSLAMLDVAEENAEATLATSTDQSNTTPKKKTTKKRKKSIKDETLFATEIKEEDAHMNEMIVAALAEIAPVSVSVSVSTNLTPESERRDLLASVSAAQSICVTPASESSNSENTSLAAVTLNAAPFTAATAAATTATTNTNAVVARTQTQNNSSSIVDTFDILKDANFYPLF